ncbi:MAG: 3-deoxy-D-manno-octulosonic acid transferase [Acidobacteriota bacterium]|nr:3-deoxy-D-manno-octulosonic acid transferase [Acidobacteriota bacterium]
MHFIYSFLLGLAFLILLPRFLFDAFRHGKYVAGFRERLGLLPPMHSDGRPVIWIHCVSVGETQAARPLVHGIRKRFPEVSIAISTTTLTGQNFAREVFKDEANRVFYFPFDWRWISRKTLKAIKPAAVLLMETELWPGFLSECRTQHIPVAIVNGRLSEKSFRRYRWIGSFMSRVLSTLQMAIMQTEADAQRLRALGMDADKTFVCGSLKFDAGTTPVSDVLTQRFCDRFDLANGAPLILAASTHAQEERVVLDALKIIISKSESQPRLMIAPRHPERFDEVAALIEASGFRLSRRTAPTKPDDQQSQVILLDSIGELQSLYSLASIVFVGGSIASTGGHNILEPAAVGACVITGAHTFNFKEIVETFVNSGAIIQLPPMSYSEATVELANIISDLLAHSAKRQALGDRARQLVNENRGATERSLELLMSMLPPANAVESTRSSRAQGAPTA